MVNWLSAKAFQIEDITFSTETAATADRPLSEGDTFTLVKTREFIDRYQELKDFRPRHILELGIFQGGSIVLFDKIFKPEKIVGVDIRDDRTPALESYIANKNPNIKTYYQSSQADEKLLKNIVENDFGGYLDFVCDDASHQYTLTRDSFRTLFPLLQPGGVYIIEDWRWSLIPQCQTKAHPWHGNTSLVNLVFELIMEIGGNNSIASMHVDRNMVIIRKSKETPQNPLLDSSRYLRKKKLTQI